MNFISELIIYVWLLPVAAQILLPLGMLGIWLLGRVFGKKGNEQQERMEAVAPGTASDAA